MRHDASLAPLQIALTPAQRGTNIWDSIAAGSGRRGTMIFYGITSDETEDDQPFLICVPRQPIEAEITRILRDKPGRGPMLQLDDARRDMAAGASPECTDDVIVPYEHYPRLVSALAGSFCLYVMSGTERLQDLCGGLHLGPLILPTRSLSLEKRGGFSPALMALINANLAPAKNFGTTTLLQRNRSLPASPQPGSTQLH